MQLCHIQTIDKNVVLQWQTNDKEMHLVLIYQNVALQHKRRQVVEWMKGAFK